MAMQPREPAKTLKYLYKSVYTFNKGWMPEKTFKYAQKTLKNIVFTAILILCYIFRFLFLLRINKFLLNYHLNQFSFIIPNMIFIVRLHTKVEYFFGKLVNSSLKKFELRTERPTKKNPLIWVGFFYLYFIWIILLTFCTANQSTKSNLLNLFDYLRNELF